VAPGLPCVEAVLTAPPTLTADLEYRLAKTRASCLMKECSKSRSKNIKVALEEYQGWAWWCDDHKCGSLFY